VNILTADNHFARTAQNQHNQYHL